jgi:hypothetical protein
VVAATGGLWTATRGAASTGPATIRVTDRQTSYQRYGDGSGSREIVRGALYSSQGHLIGSETIVCTYLGRTARMCQMSFTLPRGTIVAAGQLSSRLLYQVAIVGGTGLYDNARGTLTSTSLGLRPRRDVLLFRLAG